MNRLPSFDLIGQKLIKLCRLKLYKLFGRSNRPGTSIRMVQPCRSNKQQQQQQQQHQSNDNNNMLLFYYYYYSSQSYLSLLSSPLSSCHLSLVKVLKFWVHRPVRVVSHTKVTIYIYIYILKNWLRGFFLSISPLFQVFNFWVHRACRGILHSKLTVYVLKMWIRKARRLGHKGILLLMTYDYPLMTEVLKFEYVN